MSKIVLETRIQAPAEVCFDLMRDIRIHTETTAQTGERAVAGVTDGMIELGQTVTFEGKHLGLRRSLTVKVVEFDRPRRFIDVMIAGPFKSFVHIHEFVPADLGTLIRDTLIWESPYGIVGKIFDKLLLERNLRKLVRTRNAALKAIAEEPEK